MKVSFDFDKTLDRQEIQEFAKTLIAQGIEVHIVTARPSEKEEGNIYETPESNDDLYKVADELGILRENIHYTNHEDKAIFFREHPEFLWHLDDDDLELFYINKNTKVIAVYSKSIYFREECEHLIEEESKKGL